MERSPMLMDWQNQYCENGYIIKTNLHVHIIPVEIPMTSITEIEKSILKFIWQQKTLERAQIILSKKNKTGSFTIPYFKLYYRVIAIKTTWYWPPNKYED
jgi:hypothetical protein